MKSTGISREGPIYDLCGTPLIQHSQDPDGILPESRVIAYDLKLLSCLADIELSKLLTKRGYALIGYENVLVRRLSLGFETRECEAGLRLRLDVEV